MEFVKIRKNSSSRVSSTVPIFNFVPTDEENLPCNKYDTTLNRNRKVSNASSGEGSSESMPPSIGYPFDLKKAEDQQMLGKVMPQWISKDNVSNCTLCESKFTLVHHSYHCNACGQIVCSDCYSDLFPLEYLDGQERQICETCKVIFETRKFITDVNNKPDQEVLENEDVEGIEKVQSISEIPHLDSVLLRSQSIIRKKKRILSGQDLNSRTSSRLSLCETTSDEGSEPSASRSNSFREKQDSLDDDEIELNEEETVGSQIEIHRKNTIRLNTMDTIQEQIGEASCQRIADMFTADVENLVDNIINSDGNPCEKRKLILTTLSQLKNLKTEVNLNMHLMLLTSLFKDEGQ